MTVNDDPGGADAAPPPHTECPWTGYSKVVEWGHRHGMPWCIHANETFGSLLGYVRAPDTLKVDDELPVSVHGGITAVEGQWLGFDMLHVGDWWDADHLADLNVPPPPTEIQQHMERLAAIFPFQTRSRTIQDARDEVHHLADQVAELAGIAGELKDINWPPADSDQPRQE